MEKIHVKTVDPVSQDLLRSAARQGLKLGWERYERLQPRDGFLRVGLSCPFGCLEGPCRIDPFGRGPDRGLCGLERDGMVAALTLRLALHGALEAMYEIPLPDRTRQVSWPDPLKEMVHRALKNLGGNSLSLEEIYRAAFLLQRPLESPEGLIIHALRLGIMTVGLLEMRRNLADETDTLSCRAGYGLLAGDDIVVGISGHPSQNLIHDMQEEIFRKAPIPVRLVSLGEWIPLNDGFLPFVCTSGEAELALSSGGIDLLLVGPGADPSLPGLCRSLGVPVVSPQDPMGAVEILGLALRSSSKTSRKKFTPDTSQVQEAQAITSYQCLKESLKKDPAKTVALLGGADTFQQSLGWIPVELSTALQGRGWLVAGWGDAALWMLKGGLASKERDCPARLLGEQHGLLTALKAFAASEMRKRLQGICFTGIKTCRDLAAALGLASLGLRVCVADPLPVWGSEKACNLLAEKIATGGGVLTHFDHPASADEILEWFLKQ